MVYLMIHQRKKNFIVAENYEYKETDSKNSVQSSLKSNSLWVTLYVSHAFQLHIYVVINYLIEVGLVVMVLNVKHSCL